MKVIELATHSVSARTKCGGCFSAAEARISWKLLFGTNEVQGDTIGRSDTRVGSGETARTFPLEAFKRASRDLITQREHIADMFLARGTVCM